MSLGVPESTIETTNQSEKVPSGAMARPEMSFFTVTTSQC